MNSKLCGLQGDNKDGMKSRGGSHIIEGQRTTMRVTIPRRVRSGRDDSTAMKRSRPAVVTIHGRVKSGGAAWNSIHRGQCRGDMRDTCMQRRRADVEAMRCVHG